jgi:hypothetical protein
MRQAWSDFKAISVQELKSIIAGIPDHFSGALSDQAMAQRRL